MLLPWIVPLGANLFLVNLIAVIPQVFPWKFKKEHPVVSQLILGTFFGLLAWASSRFPVLLPSGVVLDATLSIPPLAGFFFGPISAGVVVLLGLAFWSFSPFLNFPVTAFILVLGALLGWAFSTKAIKKTLPWVWLQLLLLGVTVAVVTLVAHPIFQNLVVSIVFYPASILLIGFLLNAVESKNKTLDQMLLVTQQSQESEARFRFLAENSSDMITRHSPDGTYLYASPASERLLGYKPQELIGHAAYEFIYEEDLPNVQNSHNAILSGTVVAAVMFRGIRKDNSLIWLETTSHTIYDPDTKELLGIHATTRDISERKKFEEELQTSQANLEVLLQTRRESIWAVDREFNYTILNDFFVENYQLFFGITLKIGMNALMILSPEHQAQWRPHYEAALNGEKQTFEFTISLKNDVIIFEVFLNPIFVGNSISGVSAISLNITERQRAAQALKVSETKYRMLFENLTLGFALHKVIFNTQGDPVDYRYLEVNPAFEKLTGIKAQQIVGKRVLEVLPQTEAHWIQTFGQVAQTGTPFTYENFAQEFNKYFETIIFRPEEGHFAVLFADITERKKAEEQRRQLETELNKIQKLESLGILAGGIAHDFNNLLTGIYMNLEMARKSTSPKTLDRYLETAGKTMDRAKNLTRQLLTFSKGGVPHKKVENVADLLQETINFALSGSSVACDYQIAADLWPCELDKSQIAQVIENLVINAVQAMPQGGQLRVEAANQVISEEAGLSLASGRYVRVSLADSGMGIPSELLGQIFDPFFTTKATGHGLGLATCFSILKKHEGHIGVTSTPGKGTTFSFYLPASSETTAQESSPGEVNHHGLGKFLILDDEHVIREGLEKILTHLGYTPLSYADGEKAIEAFTNDFYQKKEIVGMIFDLTIPGKTGGREAVDKIRLLNPDIPIFVSSGYAEDEVLTKPTQYGFTASLSKPFGIDDLKNLLNRYLK
ncbi:MAG: PAS domain S-box protein [Spirochaetales bacterium]|nr:PAS domain S-box protein [Spirochaetales bacterium]